MGGANHVKIIDDHRDSLMERVSINPSLSFRELSAMFEGSFNVEFCPQTITNHLDGMLFTRKRSHYEPISMNTDDNKFKTRDFVQTLMLIM